MYINQFGVVVFKRQHYVFHIFTGCRPILLSVNFQSCIFHPLQICPSFSSPAFSSPALLSVIFQSFNFHPLKFLCPSFSCPANSAPPASAPQPTRGVGCVVGSTSGVGGAPAENGFWCISSLKSKSGDDEYYIFFSHWLGRGG